MKLTTRPLFSTLLLTALAVAAVSAVAAPGPQLVARGTDPDADGYDFLAPSADPQAAAAAAAGDDRSSGPTALRAAIADALAKLPENAKVAAANPRQGGVSDAEAAAAAEDEREAAREIAAASSPGGGAINDDAVAAAVAAAPPTTMSSTAAPHDIDIPLPVPMSSALVHDDTAHRRHSTHKNKPAKPVVEAVTADANADNVDMQSSPTDAAEPDTAAGADRRSLITSSLMIIVSEIGDKTFLIAAILAMTHPRAVVFAAALSALAVMSVLSALLGNVLPALLSRTYTQALAGLLFAVFGVRMFFEARAMPKGQGTDEEMAEVAAELEERDGDYKRLERGSSKDLNDDEGKAAAASASRTSAIKNLLSFILSPIFVETFVLTFLAEWGDRSQIATIALGAAGHVVSVMIGTIVGHSLCTGLAVVGGRMLASRISVRTVTMAGSFVFICFAIMTFAYLE
ncbi:hypothetical protein AMAG_13476 [Allomyces macrogynus ATCC 38327]|uniref:GDT1 family protein n=1 Tax=Allomyces macrogynus (strain ATCC 38327) TaxID=578462 RepID=A0A0L0T288_ALLM3|nr:hypothetical protein AMAG_13476 [Allomyces macrogynus ATCC 38327]|eukprot:KNE68837.1 hypothetical protein AMAG_13476 [Allomyces macrogynus ATCC 38327]